MIRSIPNINTARLVMRGMRPEDFERFADIWTDPEVVRHLETEPWSRGRAWDAFLRNAGHWEMTGFGQWALIEQSSRRLIGQAGFFFGSCAMGEDFDPYPEAFWVLASEGQGVGLGYEAAHAAHDWFDRIVPGRLVAKVAIDNVAALRLAAKLGYEELRETVFCDRPVVLLSRNGPP